MVKGFCLSGLQQFKQENSVPNPISGKGDKTDFYVKPISSGQSLERGTNRWSCDRKLGNERGPSLVTCGVTAMRNDSA